MDNRRFLKIFIFIAAAFAVSFTASARQQTVISLRDLTKTELKCAGFILPEEMRIHISSLGGGCSKNFSFDNSQLYAYGWIINADTRELVWTMDCGDMECRKGDCSFDGDVSLKKGSYEVYFTAYAFAGKAGLSSFNINIDHRKKDLFGDMAKKRGFLTWLEDFFGEDFVKDWDRRAKKWGIDITVNTGSPEIQTFNPPKEFGNVLFKAVRLGDNEYIKQGFTVAKSLPIRIYAEGEIGAAGPADYGWIIDLKTHRRVWELKRSRRRPPEIGDKNVSVEQTVEFAPGEYMLYFITDDSHSYTDWNAPPPHDPLNYGITLMTEDEKTKSDFRLSAPKEDRNVIVRLTRVQSEETRSSTFTLKKESALRIYALGEQSIFGRQMADYGWIINARTREKVWSMDEGRTEHAGGADKNRMIDEIINLPKGTYTVFYKTDDSHAYGDWNASPPFDPDHYGITISGGGESFSMSDVETNVSAKEPGVIARITSVGNNADRTEYFSLSKPTHVRIYALGEGQNREMYDYGWIEEKKSGNVFWEMTYSMTFHAGGGRKNRLVNTTILLDKGEYKLRYRSDDSHSFNDWNTDPPDDQAMWGITVYEEK